MQRRNEFRDILSGVFLLLGLHIAVIAILAVITYLLNSFTNILIQILFYAVFGIGLFQLLYMIPVVIWLNRKQEWGLMKGVIIGAVLTALLNGGCFLWLFSLSR